VTRRSLAAAACLALYLALVLASHAAWEPTHDEGITWLHTFGRLEVPRWPEPGASATALYGTLEGDRARSATEVLDALSTQHGMHPPAYYLLLHAWTPVFGGSALSLRWPTYLCGLLTLLGIRRLGDRLVAADGAGTAAMFLLALSPWFLTFSNYARPYALALCVAVAAQNALLAIHPAPGRPRPGPGPWIAFGSLSLAGIYLIYHYVFVLAWQLAQLFVLAFLSSRRGRRSLSRELGAVAGVGLGIAVGYAPWVRRLLAHLALTEGDRFYFGGALGAGELPQATAQLVASFALAEALRTPAAGALLLGLALLALATVVLPLRRLLDDAGESRGGAPPDLACRVAWLSTPLLPASILVADAWHGTHTAFISRTCFAFLAILVLAIVRAAWTARRPAVRRAWICAWAALLASATASDILYRSAAVRPFEAAAALVAAHDDDAHLVLVSSLRPGVLDPFVSTMRDAGVKATRFGVVASDKLAELVRREAARGVYTQVTLVDFELEDDGAGAQRERFSGRALERAAHEARLAGWSVQHPGPGGVPSPSQRNAGRVLRILGPLAGKSLDL